MRHGIAAAVHPFGWRIRITAFSSPPWTWLLSVEGHEHSRRVQQAAAGGDGAGIEAAFVTAAGRLTQLQWDQAAASVQFEDVAPVSAFPVVPGRRWGPGWWWSATTGRHVVHGLAAMRTQLMVLDRNPDVTGLAARPVRLLWRDTDGRVRSWVPQLFARYADGTGLLADCPSSPTAGGDGAQRARMVLEAACALVGWAYRRLEPPPRWWRRTCDGWPAIATHAIRARPGCGPRWLRRSPGSGRWPTAQPRWVILCKYCRLSITRCGAGI